MTMMPAPVRGPRLAQATYQMRLYDTAGVLQAVFDDWNSLYYNLRLDDYSYHQVSFNMPDDRMALFNTDSIIEVLRRNEYQGLNWYVDYNGFHRTRTQQISDRGSELFTTYGRSFEGLLNRRSILYYSGTAFSERAAGAADNHMKGIVRENVGSLATTGNSRLASGVTTGFTIATDISAAPNWSGSVAWKNVLETLQEISNAAGVDFNVVRTGAATFEFRTYYPRVGVDRTGAGAAAPVVFSIQGANMSQPYATISRADEANNVFVLGQGEGINRAVVQRNDATAQSASPWNNIEHVHDQRDATTTAALQAAGDEQLASKRASRSISFTVIESAGSIYGRDYALGDLVLARYGGLEEVKKIVGVEITVANGRENLRVKFNDENVAR